MILKAERSLLILHKGEIWEVTFYWSFAGLNLDTYLDRLDDVLDFKAKRSVDLL